MRLFFIYGYVTILPKGRHAQKAEPVQGASQKLVQKQKYSTQYKLHAHIVYNRWR